MTETYQEWDDDSMPYGLDDALSSFTLFRQAFGMFANFASAEGLRLRSDTHYLFNILKAYKAHSFQHREPLGNTVGTLES